VCSPAGSQADSGCTTAHSGEFGRLEREAIYALIEARRDVRNKFLADPVPDEVLARVLGAAHRAPSVGFSQPWDFVVIRSTETRARLARLAGEARARYAAELPGARVKAFAPLRVEAIEAAPVGVW
jgi:nicotinate-nucleotide--dimethylbenzimidazole phosphoribosyltransferase